MWMARDWMFLHDKAPDTVQQQFTNIYNCILIFIIVVVVIAIIIPDLLYWGGGGGNKLLLN
jgi:hypothetical protein